MCAEQGKLMSSTCGIGDKKLAGLPAQFSELFMLRLIELNEPQRSANCCGNRWTYIGIQFFHSNEMHGAALNELFKPCFVNYVATQIRVWQWLALHEASE